MKSNHFSSKWRDVSNIQYVWWILVVSALFYQGIKSKFSYTAIGFQFGSLAKIGCLSTRELVTAMLTNIWLCCHALLAGNGFRVQVITFSYFINMPLDIFMMPITMVLWHLTSSWYQSLWHYGSWHLHDTNHRGIMALDIFMMPITMALWLLTFSWYQSPWHYDSWHLHDTNHHGIMTLDIFMIPITMAL